MGETNVKRRIIDQRNKSKFQMDDKFLDGYAKLCGWQATLVYLCLCRHVNSNQECFPSVKLMKEKLRVSRNTIIKGLKNLELHNIIQVKRNRNKRGIWINNTYILIDKSKWKSTIQVPEKDTGIQVPLMTQPSPSGDKIQVPVRDYKETHNKDTHIRKEKNPKIPVDKSKKSPSEQMREAWQKAKTRICKISK